jgi:hypothetical protein
MATQVITPHTTKASGSEALARAFGAYKDLQAGNESSSKADYYNSLQDNAEQEKQFTEDGIVTPSLLQKHVQAGGQVFYDSPDKPLTDAQRNALQQGGAAQAYLNSDPETTLYMTVPVQKELKAPNLKEVPYQDKSGQNKIGWYDVTTGRKVSDDATDILAPKQPKSSEELQAAADIKANAKVNDTQDKKLTQVQSLLEGMRGNPAVQQAEKDVYAAGKVNSLVNQVGDPNNMTREQAALLAGEVAKIAQGGSPTIHELDVLTPNTLQTKFAAITQRLTGEPTPANAGEFIKQYKEYADNLTKDAQKLITDRYGRILTVNKSKLSSDDYNSLNDAYLNRFKDAAKEADVKIGQNKGGPGQAVAAPALEIGVEQKGYIYQGGDPASPSAWKKK